MLNVQNFQSASFNDLIRELRLDIICADDSYLNLEALGAVMKNLGLLKYTIFMSNGGQVVEHCIKSVDDLADRGKTV